MTFSKLSRTYHAREIISTYSADAEQARTTALLNREATEVEQKLIDRSELYYSKDKVSVLQTGYKKYYLVWALNGKYYGFDMPYCDYSMCIKVKEQLEQYPLDETGIEF